jgi:uncharacterized protein YukE
MADPRTFVLIGEFKDGITPELAKINNQLAQLKQTFAKVGGKGARTASRDIGKFNAAVEGLNNTLQTQNKVLRSTIEPMRQYRREVGKTVGALKKLDEAGGRSIAIERTNQALREQIKLMDQLRSRKGMPTPRMPREERMGGRRGGYGGGGGGGRPPRGGESRNFGFEGHMGEFGFAYQLGMGISQPIQNAIVQGFQIGVGMMTKPFQYFANAFGERVQDQISDLKAAGALYSISKRSQNPFLKDIDEAIEFQQQTNATFANLAKDLPGVTNDYVQVGKRLSDTAARIVEDDFGKALKFAQEIRQKEGGKYYGTAEQLTTMQGPRQKQEVLETILGNLTKKTTLGGLGNRSGAGGIAGAYGLPGIVERLISEEEVSVAKFQRYASVFSDPAIADALQRNVEKINATARNSVERAKMLDQVLDEIVTPDMIEKMRISVDGIYQGLRSMILDPDTGLFGLGRQFENIGKRMNSYGQYIGKFGQVVENASQAADVDLSLFEILSDIFANLGQVLMPLVEILPQLFDPLKKLANILMDARHYTAELNRSFNLYRNGLKELAKSDSFKYLSKDGLMDVRASLLALGNIMRAFGVIDMSEFTDLSKQITGKDFEKNLGPIISGLIDQLMNSEIAENIGKMIGTLVGTVIAEVAKVTGFVSGRLKGSNKLFKGLQEGFDAAGGSEAIGNIFKDVFTSMFNVLKEILKIIPLQGYILIAAATVLPAIVQGGAMLLAESIGKGLKGMFDATAERVTKSFNKAPAPTGPGRTYDPLTGAYRGPRQTPKLSRGARMRNLLRSGVGAGEGAQSLLGPGLLREAKNLKAGGVRGALSAAKGLPVRIVGVAKAAATGVKGAGGLGGLLSKGGKGLAGLLGKGVGMLGKTGGALTVGVGIFEALMSLLSGDSLGTALGKGAGPILGTIIGTALLGPLGGFIGGWIGSMESVTEPLGQAFESVVQTLTVTFEFLGQIGSDISGLVGLLPGLGEGFDLLKFALFALLSPFRLLELGIRGLYVLYLQMKANLGLASKEDREKLEENKKVLAQRTAQFAVEGDEARGISREKQLKEAEAKLAELQAKRKKRAASQGGQRSSRASTSSTEEQQLKDRIAELKKTPDKKGKSPAKTIDKPIQTTATKTTDLDKKAGAQVKETTEVKASTEKTTAAVKDLTAKITSQSPLQTTVAAIYNLLASGSLRVQTQQTSQNFFFNGLKNGGLGDLPFDTTQTDPNKPSSIFTFPPKPKANGLAKGALGDAIASEMRMKPPGSDLVIANSSETVIPAAGGNGMMDFVEVLRSGFNAMVSTYRATQQKQENVLNSIRNTLVSNQQQTNARLQKLETKFATPGMGGGGLGGAAAGGVDAFTPIAQRMGLTMTSGYRPGDPGWHGANRARDFSNGTGPTPQMMQFAQYMASTYGSNLKELIYTPLGFSIKNGQRVAPYAQGSHYNHVHVAYANGLGNPIVAPTGDLARKIDEKALGRANVKTFTAGNGEFGSGTTINGGINVTVNGSGIDDVDTLASVIALKIGDAVSDARAASLFV